MIGLVWLPQASLLVDLREWPLFTEDNLPYEWRGRPWFRRCAFCRLDEGGAHFDGCPWLALTMTWTSIEAWEAQDAADQEAEARLTESLRREREEAWRAAYYDREDE